MQDEAIRMLADSVDEQTRAREGAPTTHPEWDRLVRTMVQKAGLPIEAACRMMSLHPAKLLRREDELGSIAPGKKADLVLMDDDLHAARVFVGGREAFAS